MKRVKYACLEQTVHFMLKDDMPQSMAVKAVQSEAEAYKAQLDRKRIKYEIEDETVQQDGSILMKIKKQYNDYPCGDYLK